MFPHSIQEAQSTCTEWWGLEIGKDGFFHKRLNKAGIQTVEDFLRLVVRDAQRLWTVSMRVGCQIVFPTHILFYLFLSIILDSWEWHVKENVGSSCWACKDLCSERETLYLLLWWCKECWCCFQQYLWIKWLDI